MDEGPDLVVILDPDGGLDPARDIDSTGIEFGHDRAHVTGFETAGDEYLPSYQQLAREIPIRCLSGTAALVDGPGIEHDRVRPPGGVGDLAIADLQHLDGRAAGVEPGLLRRVQLEHVEADEVGDLPDLGRVLVDEDAHDLRPHRQGVDDRLGLLGRDAPIGGAEMEPEQVRACFHRRLGGIEVADSADFHPDHYKEANSRRHATGSVARMSISPTRIASAPDSRIRRASSIEWMPLSATSRTVVGIKGRSLSVSPRSTSNVRRSRWLTPTTFAPASMATLVSPPSRTSTRAGRLRLRTTASSL